MKKKFYIVIVAIAIVLILVINIQNHNIKKSIENDMYINFNELAKIYEETVQVLNDIIYKSSISEKDSLRLKYFNSIRGILIIDIDMRAKILMSNDKYQRINRNDFYPNMELDTLRSLIHHNYYRHPGDYVFDDALIKKIKKVKIYLEDQKRIINNILISKDYNEFSGFNKKYVYIDEDIYR